MGTLLYRSESLKICLVWLYTITTLFLLTLPLVISHCMDHRIISRGDNSMAWMESHQFIAKITMNQPRVCKWPSPPQSTSRYQAVWLWIIYTHNVSSQTYHCSNTISHDDHHLYLRRLSCRILKLTEMNRIPCGQFYEFLWKPVINLNHCENAPITPSHTAQKSCACSLSITGHSVYEICSTSILDKHHGWQHS